MTEPPPAPTETVIEIDRVLLRRYYRREFFRGWMVVAPVVGTAFGVAIAAGTLEGKAYADGIREEIFRSAAMGVMVAWLAGLILFHLVAAPLIDRFTSLLKASIEGSFLRVCKWVVTRTDRKIDVRCIVDCTVVQDTSMRRLGIHMLSMRTTAQGDSALISIPGVKDGERMRDLICEMIDRN